LTAVLADTVAGLALAVVLLIALITVVRERAVRRRRQEAKLRPPAERLLAEFLVGSPRVPPMAGQEMAGQDERAILLQAALEALSDLRGSERTRLVELLEQLGYARQAISELAARRRAVRRRAAETLAAMASPQAVPALTAGLADRDVLVRTTCARILAEMGGEETVPLVVAAAGRDVLIAPGAAAAVVLALGQRRPAALAPLLGPGAPPELRAIAITIVAELRLAQHAPALEESLSDSDIIAASAARGLGLIGESRATRALARLALDEQRSPSARAEAVTALGSIGDPAEIHLLERLIAAADWPVQAAAARALARLGALGIAALHRAARSSQPQVRELAEAAVQS
jgi:HEAT repeat protein